MASPSSSSSGGSSLSLPGSAVFVTHPLRNNGGIVYHSIGREGGNSGSFQTPVVGPSSSSKQQNHVKTEMMTCHMDWITDLMPRNLSPQDKGTYLTGILQALLKARMVIERNIVDPGTRINMRMKIASFYAYLEQFKEALDWINGATEDSLGTLPDERCKNPTHIQAYAYLLRLNFCKINRGMKLKEGMNMELVEEGSAQELKEIEEMYGVNEEAFQAALCFAQATLARSMNNEDKQIEVLRIAVVLEPTCAQWHRALYGALRKKRTKSAEFGPTRDLPDLSPEEIMAITTAYDLDPDCRLNQSMYARMLEEKMKSRRYRNLVLSNVKEETCDELISLLRKNPEHEFSRVRLAEIYAYGHYPHLDPKEGERMFQELEERWPKSSMVLHKFGKYFAEIQKEPWKAFDYYTRGLDCNIGNFPCLMDYLKTCQILRKGHDDMLAMVEKCLRSGHLYDDGRFIKIMLAKGILLWILDKTDGGTGKKEACKAWIVAVEKDLDSSVWIARTIAFGRWYAIGKYSINLNQLDSILVDFLCREKEPSNYEQVKAIERLISEIRNQRIQTSQEAIRCGLRNGDHNSASSTRTSVSSNSNAIKKTSFSLADSVSNWREPASQIPPLTNGNGIFAKYEDPMDLRFRGALQPGYKLGLTTVPLPLQSPQHKFVNGGEGRGYGKEMSQADLDDDWRH